MKCKQAALFFLIVVVLFSIIFKSSGAQENNKPEKRFNTIFYFSTGIALGTVANDFFIEYNDPMKLAGSKKSFVNSPLLSAGTKLDFFSGFRIGVHIEYLYSEMREAYIHSITEKTHDQEILINSIPAFLTFELVPFNQQFRTYAGLGAGVCFSEIFWKEEILDAGDTEIRKGGIHYDEQGFYPAFRIYTGIELGFDSKVENSFLGSLILEVNYTYIHRRENIFGDISKQYTEVPANWDEKYSIIPGYLGLNIGISFNFNKKTVNSKNN